MSTTNTRLVPRTPFHPKPNPIPSSSPAFATPVHPIRSALDVNKLAPILPILLPPATLRPIAFRTFTKKHNLTLTSAALQALATFVGKHCGSAWREEGLAEMVLEEVARMWKRGDGRVIVDGDSNTLKDLLKQLEGSMSGGRVVIGKPGRSLSRQASLAMTEGPGGLQRQDSFGLSGLDIEDEDDNEAKEPRSWLKVINSYEQPRMVYNAAKKHFEKSKTPATYFPSPSQKTELFRQRYHLVHQRVLRNESFQKSSISSHTNQEWKITPITNLLGRSGTSHLLLGLLTIAPTGTLAISDLTGSISLDLEQATPIDSVETWLCPGMIVLVDGVYEEEFNSAGGNLGNMGGIGGTIGGRFVGFSVGAPKCETRAATLGLSDNGQASGDIGGGFGWVDFLGVGSDRATGSRMRKIEQRLLQHHGNASVERTNSNKVVILGDVNLDNPKTLVALRKVLLAYSPSSNLSNTNPSSPPLAFVLMGNFVSQAAMSSTSASRAANTHSTNIPDSISYKEYFDALALLLSDFPHLLRHSTWIFVPGDNDPWPSSFSAGSAVPLPRGAVPELFTSRIKRAFVAANGNTEAGAGSGVKKEGRVQGEAVWTTNPSRVSLFGSSQEFVLFRDDVSSRLRRNAVNLKKSNHATDGEHDAVDAEMQISQAPPDASDIDATDATQENTTTTTTAMDIDTTPATTIPANTTTTAARALTKSLLDQSHLSPFPLSLRPLHWSFAHALNLYPLPSTLMLCDAEVDPFVCVYQGCCVINAGRLVGGGRGAVRWVEWDVGGRKGTVRVI